AAAEAATRRSGADQSGDPGIPQRRRHGAGTSGGSHRSGENLSRNPGAAEKPPHDPGQRGNRYRRADDRIYAAAAGNGRATTAPETPAAADAVAECPDLRLSGAARAGASTGDSPAAGPRVRRRAHQET